MAVVACNEIWDNRDHTYDQEFVREYTRAWRLMTSDPKDEGTVIRAHLATLGIDVYAQYENADGTVVDDGAMITKIDLGHDQDDPRFWIATATYSTESLDEDQQADNPLDRPAKISWTSERFSRAIQKDRNNVLVANSAGDPFDPPIEIDDSRFTLTITRNEASFDVAQAEQFINTLNAEDFYGFPPGTAKMSDISSNRMFEKDQEFWETTYKIQFRHELQYDSNGNPIMSGGEQEYEGWNFAVLDAGWRATDSNTGNIETIQDGGVPRNKPSLLNGASQKLADGGTPVYLDDFFFYYLMPFSDLALE